MDVVKVAGNDEIQAQPTYSHVMFGPQRRRLGHSSNASRINCCCVSERRLSYQHLTEGQLAKAWGPSLASPSWKRTLQKPSQHLANFTGDPHPFFSGTTRPLLRSFVVERF